MKALSLKARAIALLAQREHSAAELRRKLLRIETEKRRQLALAAGDAAEPGLAAMASEDVAEVVEVLLVWLQAQGYLDECRFVESRIHARATRFGSARIKLELAQHRLGLNPEQANALRASEFERARLVWQRKFGVARALALPTAAEAAAWRAKQGRFLLQRGFDAEVIRKVLRGSPE